MITVLPFRHRGTKIREIQIMPQKVRPCGGISLEEQNNKKPIKKTND